MKRRSFFNLALFLWNSILDLQKDRFFEFLQAKYWNHSKRGECDNSDNNEGITLESLGKFIGNPKINATNY